MSSPQGFELEKHSQRGAEEKEAAEEQIRVLLRDLRCLRILCECGCP
jgi:hypothetical protein